MCSTTVYESLALVRFALRRAAFRIIATFAFAIDYIILKFCLVKAKVVAKTVITAEGARV